LSLQQEIDAFDPGLHLDRASTPPSSWYRSPEIFEAERSRVFAPHWQPIGRLDALNKAGAYVTMDVAGEPLVALHGDDGELRAFFNVCRHHATCVLRGAGHTDRVVCPYHGWEYHLDGRLKKAPRLGAARGFAREDHGLLPIEIATWGPWAFVRAQAGGPSLESVVAPVQDRLNLEGLRFFARRAYELDCNWKVYVDNYLDGGYHVAHLHRRLASSLDLDSYRTEVFDYASIQSCRGGAQGSARIGEEQLYIWLHPAFMINRYGPFMDTNFALPLGPNRCRVVFDYFIDESFEASDEFLEESLAASDEVQQEDVDICESVQRGLGSSAFDTGRYSVTHERAAHHFHRLLHADLSVAAASACVGATLG